jgi:hypothetical protein
MVSLNLPMSKRDGSSVPQFRIRVPAKVADQVRGKHVLLSLGNPNDRPFVKVIKIGADVAFSLETEHRLIAEARQANALDHFKRLFQLTEADPVRLSHRDLVAPSGEAYRIYADVNGENPGERSKWAYHKALSRAALKVASKIHRQQR